MNNMDKKQEKQWVLKMIESIDYDINRYITTVEPDSIDIVSEYVKRIREAKQSGHEYFVDACKVFNKLTQRYYERTRARSIEILSPRAQVVVSSHQRNQLRIAIKTFIDNI